MKIVAILDTHLSAGGGFNQALNAILQIHRLSEGLFEFETVTHIEDNVPFLQRLGVAVSVYRRTWRDKWVASLSKKPSGQSFLSRHKILSGMERHLLGMGTDLVYFVRPESGFFRLQRLNYITTLWDLCHRDHPEFPEVREFGTFHRREEFYRYHLPPAVCILTDSENLSRAASFRYGIDPERFLSMPFAPSPFLDRLPSTPLVDVLKKYDLSEGYFFYPAQFWPHKNHIRILEALLLLRDSGKTPTVVFSGKDYGTEPYLKSFVKKHHLQEQVRFLGFVDPEDIRGLYEGCKALVMPSYFGPTNLPPLEAWALKRPVIYSALHRDQAGDAALLVDPDNAAGLAHAMDEVNDPNTRHRLVETGAQRLNAISLARAAAEQQFLRTFETFRTRRACWL